MARCYLYLLICTSCFLIVELMMMLIVIINNGFLHYCHVFSLRENSEYRIRKEKIVKVKQVLNNYNISLLWLFYIAPSEITEVTANLWQYLECSLRAMLTLCKSHLSYTFLAHVYTVLVRENITVACLPVAVESWEVQENL